MIRDDRRVAQEALKWAAVMKARKKRRRERISAGAAVACLAAFICFVAFQRPYSSEGPPVAAAHAPIMHDGAGGHVLAAVAGFALGALVIYWCVKSWRRKSKGEK